MFAAIGWMAIIYGASWLDRRPSGSTYEMDSGTRWAMWSGAIVILALSALKADLAKL